MKFHGPSLALGFSSAIVVAFAARRLRPVSVEVAALGLQFARMGRALIELQRENIEDFWFDVQHRSDADRAERRKARVKYDKPSSTASGERA